MPLASFSPAAHSRYIGKDAISCRSPFSAIQGSVVYVSHVDRCTAAEQSHDI